jgi:hypothetical protein
VSGFRNDQAWYRRKWSQFQPGGSADQSGRADVKAAYSTCMGAAVPENFVR